MSSAKKIISMAILVVLLVSNVVPQVVFSLTVKEEEELSRQVLQMIFRQFEIVDDPVVVAYVDKIGKRILGSLPEQPFRYNFYVIKEDVYNAFATPAGHIFVYTGLLDAMEEEEELAGILGHEIAHVYCRHISRKIERSKRLTVATLAGVAAGVLLGAAGGGEAASAVTMGSMAAGQAAELAYSREDEMQADQFGLDFLTKAGYSASGLLKILKKIRSKQWFGSEQIPTYLMTHPAVEDRITYIGSWLENYERTSKSIPLVNPVEFQRIHTRVETRFGDEEVVLSRLQSEVTRNPQDPFAHYRYGLILARIGKRQDAIEHMRKALTKRAFDAYILKDLGYIYFLDGQYTQALKTLSSACGMIPKDTECQFYLGRTQLEMGQLNEATENFLNLIQQEPKFTPAYYYLGQSMGKQQKLGDAHYYLGVYHLRKRDFKTAQIQLQLALKHNKDPKKRSQIESWLDKLSKKSDKGQAQN